MQQSRRYSPIAAPEVVMLSTTSNAYGFFQTGEILRSSWLTW